MRMLSLSFIVATVALLAASADTGDHSAEYTHLELHRVGTMKGNFQTGHMLDRMEDGVNMTFVATDPEKSLRIQADTVDFVYENEDGAQPTGILLRGSVTIEVAENVIESGRADIDLSSGQALFTENPRMNAEQMQNLRAKQISVNLNTGDFQVDQGEIERMDFGLLGPNAPVKGADEAQPKQPDRANENDH